MIPCATDQASGKRHYAKLKICGFEHFSSPFKIISSTIGENVSNPFMAFTKISIIVKVKLVNALSSASTEDLPQLCHSLPWLLFLHPLHGGLEIDGVTFPFWG